MNRVRFLLQVALLNICSVALLLYGMTPQKVPTQTVNAQAAVVRPQPLPPTVKSGKPVRLYIERLGIELPVNEGVYDPELDIWTLTDNAAFYAVPTPLLNDQSGNTLIYGHNYQSIFGRITELRVGDIIVLHTDNNKIFSYVFESSQAVEPNDLTVFGATDTPQLTLLTCVGNFNEQRQMARFSLKSVL